MNVNSAKQDLSFFSPSQDRLSSLGGILKEDWSTVFGKRSQKGLIIRHQGVMCTYISSPSVHIRLVSKALASSLPMLPEK